MATSSVSQDLVSTVCATVGTGTVFIAVIGFLLAFSTPTGSQLVDTS